MTATDTFTATEIAAALEVTPKALRRWIRSQDAACGKGNHYGFSADEARALIRDFRNRPATASSTARSADEVRALLAEEVADEVDDEELAED